MSIFLGLIVAGGWALFALITGYPLFCLLRTFDQRPLRLDWIELVFVNALLGSLVIGWIGLLLAEAGLFKLSLLTIGSLLVMSGVALWTLARHGDWRPQAAAPDKWTWAILFVAALAAVLFFHPDEFILGGADAGVYVNLGANIARTGSLLIHESELTALLHSVWPALFRQTPPGAATLYLRFPAFYISDQTPGLIIPQFFALHPVWLAIGYSVLGLRASLYMTPLWAVMGVVALALALKRAFTARVGVLAAFLLTVTSAQVYFARYPTAEPLTQFLIWGGLYSFIAFATDEHPLWGVLSGLTLGQVFLVRIDAIPLLLLPAVWLVYALRHRTWLRQLWFFVPFVLMLIHSALHAVLFSWPYTWEIYGSVGRLGMFILQRAGWLLPVVLAGVLVFFWKVRRTSLTLKLGQSLMRWVAAVATVALGVFAYWVWPRIGQTVMAPYWYGATSIPVQNHLNLVRLGWYFSPLGIWLGIAGVALIFLTGVFKRMWPVLVTGLAFSALYLYNILNNPFHIYAVRRYVPAVFPFLAAGAAFALLWVWEQRHKWKPAAVVACVLGLALVGWLAYDNRAVWNMVEYRGAIVQIEQLAAAVEPNAVLLFEENAPVGAGSTVGTPLQYLYGLTAFDLQEDRIDPTALAEQIARWQAAGRTVYWIRGVLSSTLPAPLRLLPVQETTIRLPRLEQSYDHFPLRREELQIPLQVYRVRTASEADDCHLPVRMDIGGLDASYVQSGFYAPEKFETRTVRWTSGAAVVSLPCLPAAPISVTVYAGAIGRASARLAIEFDGQPVGAGTVGRDFQSVSAQIPAQLVSGAPHTLTLRSDTWIPQQQGLNSDARTLGVLVDWIELSPAQP